MTHPHRIPLLALTLSLLGACSTHAPPRWEQPRLVSQTRAAPLEVTLPASAAPAPNGLGRAQRAALEGFAASYRARPGDRLQLSFHPQRRDAALDSAEWLAERDLPVALKSDPLLPPDTLLLGLWQSRVHVPECGTWNGATQADFGNQPWPDFGCSVTRNLGLMIADPADLSSPDQLRHGSGEEAAAAIQRHREFHQGGQSAAISLPFNLGGSGDAQ